MGTGNTSGSHGTAVGFDNKIPGTSYSTAVGVSNEVKVSKSLVFGNMTEVTKDATKTVVLGGSSSNSGGAKNSVSVANSVILGMDSNGAGPDGKGSASDGSVVNNPSVTVTGTTYNAAEKIKIGSTTYSFAGTPKKANGIVSVGKSGAERQIQHVSLLQN